METWFRGRFEIRIDEKGRLRFPASLQSSGRKALSLVVTNSLFRAQRFLDIYSLEAWEKLESKISQLSQLKAEVQAFQRFYISGAQVMELDSSGRILIPPGLRKYASLETNAVLVGMGDKLELWNLNTWNRLYEGLAENFEETMAAVAKLESKDQE